MNTRDMLLLLYLKQSERSKADCLVLSSSKLACAKKVQSTLCCRFLCVELAGRILRIKDSPVLIDERIENDVFIDVHL